MEKIYSIGELANFIIEQEVENSALMLNALEDIMAHLDWKLRKKRHQNWDKSQLDGICVFCERLAKTMRSLNPPQDEIKVFSRRKATYRGTKYPVEVAWRMVYKRYG